MWTPGKPACFDRVRGEASSQGVPPGQRGDHRSSLSSAGARCAAPNGRPPRRRRFPTTAVALAAEGGATPPPVMAMVPAVGDRAPPSPVGRAGRAPGRPPTSGPPLFSLPPTPRGVRGGGGGLEGRRAGASLAQARTPPPCSLGSLQKPAPPHDRDAPGRWRFAAHVRHPHSPSPLHRLPVCHPCRSPAARLHGVGPSYRQCAGRPRCLLPPPAGVASVASPPQPGASSGLPARPPRHEWSVAADRG